MYVCLFFHVTCEIFETDEYEVTNLLNIQQAINNLQSTFYGFGMVSGDNVFKVRNISNELKIIFNMKSL